jgi:7-carboxy-7-deazaguanine synthase
VYCDTAYAFTGGKKIKIEEIIVQVEQYGTKYITITGGEPLAQPVCIELIKQLLDKEFIVSVETSGAIDVSGVDSRAVKVMDLKTPSSGELDKNIYQNIDFLSSKDQVKFVIGNNEDYDWSKATIVEYGLLERCEVLFSPVMGLQNPTELAEKILQDRLPVRFQIQLHKLLWDNIQGK